MESRRSFNHLNKNKLQMRNKKSIRHKYMFISMGLFILHNSLIYHLFVSFQIKLKGGFLKTSFLDPRSFNVGRLTVKTF